MKYPQLLIDWFIRLYNDICELPPVEAIGFLVLLIAAIELRRLSKPSF